MVAYALEAHPALLPYVPELLADMEELGSDAQAITGAVKNLGLPESATVVDLGCGKGAVAVRVAEDLNLEVLGIDLFEPFVASCRALAQSRGVSGKCRFIRGDILKLVGKVEPRDVVIMAALGDVLGPLEQTVSVVRQYARPGGYMIISDGFIKDGGSSDFPGFEQYAGHDDMLARLTACGDRFVSEIIDEINLDQGEEKLIAARAEAIAARQPGIAAQVLEYAKAQAAEYRFMDENFTGAIWVLQRSDRLPAAR